MSLINQLKNFADSVWNWILLLVSLVIMECSKRGWDVRGVTINFPVQDLVSVFSIGFLRRHLVRQSQERFFLGWEQKFNLSKCHLVWKTSSNSRSFHLLCEKLTLLKDVCLKWAESLQSTQVWQRLQSPSSSSSSFISPTPSTLLPSSPRFNGQSTDSQILTVSVHETHVLDKIPLWREL